MQNTMEFIGGLPEQCPPAKARNPLPEEVVYRLGYLEDSYSAEDFLSHWDKHPQNRTKYSTNPGECQAKALSVFTSEEEARNASRLPSLKKKIKSTLHLKLHPSDGLLIQTGNNIAHYSLWLSRIFTLDKAGIHVIPL